MKNNIETPLEQVFTYGVGTTSEDIQGNDKAYFNLKAHAMKTAKQAILSDLLEIIEDVPLDQPLDDEMDYITLQGHFIFRKAVNWQNERLREKVKEYCK